jgi:hypothetical protein
MAIAYLIDSAKRTVTQVEYANVTDINNLIGCHTFCLGYANHINGDTMYVDDEGLLHNPQHFFLFDHRADQPLAGNGLFVGREIEGDEYPNGYTTKPPTMTLATLRKKIFFVSRRVLEAEEKDIQSELMREYRNNLDRQ